MTDIISASESDVLFDKLYEKIKSDLDEGRQVVLVVPAQSTLSAEKKAFGTLGAEGFFRLRIIRGQKLYEEIMRETGFPGLISINRLGRSMLLRKIASECTDDFSVFQSVAKEAGFIDMAGDFIVQLKQNKITDSEYVRLMSLVNDESLFKQKLKDMKLVYDKYNEAMLGKFTDSEDMLSFVTEKARESSFVKKSKFYYFDFYSFTSNELAFLSCLDSCSEGLCIAVLSGKGERFAATRRTITRIKNVISDANTEFFGKDENPALSSLNADGLHIVRCAGPYTQAQTIASYVMRLVREKGYSYKDFAVLTGDNPSMQGIIKRVFNSCGIPFFADEKRSVLHNKAAEAVISLVDIAAGNFRTQDMIRFCKSETVQIKEDELDVFCNYLKQYHIKGSSFNKEFKYGKKEYAYYFSRLEALRSMLSSILLPFTEKFSSSETVIEKTRVLYEFLEEKLHFSAAVEKKSEQLSEEGFVDAAEEYSAVWDVIISLFDQMAELLGDTKISDEEYGKILNSSFADIKVGVLPQAEGRVSVGNAARSLPGKVRTLFIAGFNEGIIPKDSEGLGILTQSEQETALENGFTLSKPSDVALDEELFSVYKCMDCAEDNLYLMYCVSDSDGNDIKMSSLISDIKEKHPELTEENDISNKVTDFDFAEGKKLSAERLSELMRKSVYNNELSEFWKDVYNELKEENSQIASGLRYSGSKPPLGKEIARKLFAKENEYSLSPSRMDGFAACPFKHYIHYGLMPEEPREFGVGGSEAGTVYHEALLRLCSEIEDWNSVSDDEIEAKLDAVLADISSELLDGVLISGKPQLYTSKRIRNVCLKFAKHMAEQIRQSSIEKMYLETGFGRGRTFPAVEITTAAGKVYVEGRIDRVDVCRKDDGTYVRVIDYKSGNTKFDKGLIEKGLSLQLMVYLEGALGNYPSVTDGGIYYFNIKEPQAASAIEDLPKEEIAESVLEKINREYRLSGMDVDKDFIESFTGTLTGLCEKLALGVIDAAPKKIGSTYDSCTYCEYSCICLKDVNTNI